MCRWVGTYPSKWVRDSDICTSVPWMILIFNMTKMTPRNFTSWTTLNTVLFNKDWQVWKHVVTKINAYRLQENLKTFTVAHFWKPLIHIWWQHSTHGKSCLRCTERNCLHMGQTLRSNLILKRVGECAVLRDTHFLFLRMSKNRPSINLKDQSSPLHPLQTRLKPELQIEENSESTFSHTWSSCIKI